jgi:hypothetical protein
MTTVPVQLLELALAYVARGAQTWPLKTCHLCKRRARLARGADRCSRCVAEAIEQALGRPSPPRRWSIYYDACQECGGTERPHAAHGYCDRCIGRSAVRGRA